jgi:hypothetical protein
MGQMGLVGIENLKLKIEKKDFSQRTLRKSTEVTEGRRGAGRESLRVTFFGSGIMMVRFVIILMRNVGGGFG